MIIHRLSLFAAFLALAGSCKTRNSSSSINENSRHSENLEIDRKKNQVFRPLVEEFVKFTQKQESQNAMGKILELGRTRFFYPMKSPWVELRDLRPEMIKRGLIDPQKDPNALGAIYEIQKTMIRVGQGAEFWRNNSGMVMKRDLGLILPVPRPGVSHLLGTLTSFVGPLSEYGPEATMRLAVTGFSMVQLALSDEFNTIAKPMFKDSTIDFPLARARDKDAERESYNDHLRTFVEGIVTIYQSINFLAFSKVEGLDFDTLIARLIEPPSGSLNGFLAKFASSMPAPFVGPSAHAGSVFPGSVILDKDGTLKMAPKLHEILREVRDECIEREKEVGHASCRGCPLARTGPGKDGTSSVQLVGSLFLEIFKTTKNLQL